MKETMTTAIVKATMKKLAIKHPVDGQKTNIKNSLKESRNMVGIGRKLKNISVQEQEHK